MIILKTLKMTNLLIKNIIIMIYTLILIKNTKKILQIIILFQLKTNLIVAIVV